MTRAQRIVIARQRRRTRATTGRIWHMVTHKPGPGVYVYWDSAAFWRFVGRGQR